MPDDPRSARLNELLLDRALFGLSAAEEAELQILSAELGRPIDESFEMTAAALDLAMGPPPEPMPVTLRNRLLAAADAWSADRRAGADANAELHELTLVGLKNGSRLKYRPSEDVTVGQRLGASWRVWGGWVAAAACLAVAVTAWNRPAQSPVPDGLGTATGEPSGQRAGLVDPTVLLDRLKVDSTTKTTALVVNEPVMGPPPIAGDIFWSDARQEGVLKISGLPPIQHPGDEYQLWITDALRDERYPVDGGLFRVEPGQKDVKVLIKPRVRIDCATTFAITVERAGGVVVSDRRSLVATGVVSEDASAVRFEPVKPDPR